MPRVALLVGVVTLTVGCGSNPVAPPPPPPPPSCQANNTADVSFGNRSSTTTMDIVWDGVRILTLPPGQTSPSRAVAAGVQHTLEARITNTSLLACNVSTPIPAQCSTPVYTCAGP